MTEVIFSFDTEDFVTPESDDALKGIADTLTRHGIRGSFAIVGEKARALRRRYRKDVIDAVRPHDVQYHSNTHMVWPQLTLELSRMKWDEGLNLVMETERHGVEDVAETFGQRPVVYVRCGGNWDPRELYGMALLGLKAHVPSEAMLPADRPAWYVNMLHYPHNFYPERYFNPGLTLKDMRREFFALKEKIAGSPWPIVAIAHPTMFVTSQFYDLHNSISRGVFPPKREWKPAPLLSRAEARRRMKIFDSLVRFVCSQKDVAIITHSDFVREYEEQPRWITLRQLQQVAADIKADFNYVAVGGGFLSPADVFGVLSQALSRCAETGDLPQRLPVRRIMGPAEPAPALAEPFKASPAQVMSACAQCEDEIDLRHRMPNEILLCGRRTPPASFLVATADTAILLAGKRSGQVVISPGVAHPRCKTGHLETVHVGSSELPHPFNPGTIVTYTHQQTWTVRPAVRRQE